MPKALRRAYAGARTLPCGSPGQRIDVVVVYHPDLLVPVGFSSVCDSHHEHDKRICEHFLDNPVITHAQSAEPPVRSLQRCSDQRSLGQAVDGGMMRSRSCFGTRSSSLAALRLI